MSILSTMVSQLNRVLAGQKELAASVKKLEAGQKELARETQLDQLAKQLADVRQQQLSDGDVLRRIEVLLTVTPLPAPLPITEWRVIGERKENEMSILKYEAVLPPIPDVPENSDVVTQRVAGVVDGSEVFSQDLARDATVVTFEVDKGKMVTLSRSLVDDDDNVGPVSASETFLAKDTIAPSSPGDFGEIKLLSEREGTLDAPPVA